MIRLSRAEARGLRRSKYRAVPTVVDGIRFASRREAVRYAELQVLVRCGAILHLELQPKFPLVVEGRKVCEYWADFSFIDAVTGEVIIEDAKGMKTRAYAIKRKLFEALYPFTIREV